MNALNILKTYIYDSTKVNKGIVYKINDIENYLSKYEFYKNGNLLDWFTKNKKFFLHFLIFSIFFLEQKTGKYGELTVLGKYSLNIKII